MSNKLDLSQVSTDDLLAALDTRPASGSQIVERWLEAEGYMPGETKTPARELLDKFWEWCARTDHPKVHHNTFGLTMMRKFRHSRGKIGRFYYTSKIQNSQRIAEAE